MQTPRASQTKVAFETLSKLRQLAYFRVFLLPSEGNIIRVLNVRLATSTEFATRFVAVPAPGGPGPNILLEVFGLAAMPFDFAEIVMTIELEGKHGPEELVFDHPTMSRLTLRPKYTVMQTWNQLMAGDAIRSIIDIGGRARSGVSRKHAYPGKSVLVTDILSSPDVDLVADVHELSERIAEKFDAFMSIATFEHLLMPWKAAVEINKVLNDRAVGLIVTHQAVGVHDLPWDFYRYSSEAWKGIFNSYTGFEVVDAGMTEPAMIIPRLWQRQFDNTENAVGYITSGVVVRKISEPSLDWRARTSKITSDTYPH